MCTCVSERKDMNEKDIERKLKRDVEDAGGLALKFTSPGYAGVPDRIVLMPGGMMGFIELKAPGKVMRPLQVKRKKQLESLGFRVFCIDSTEQIKGVIDEIQGT